MRTPTNPLASYLLPDWNRKSPAGSREACNDLILLSNLVAGVGFEPTTFRL